MAQCKDCIHNGVCKIYSGFIKNHDCELFVSTADVVPKSEAENYRKIAEHQQSVSMRRYFEIKQLKEELAKAKQEVAREIFEEIEDNSIIQCLFNSKPMVTINLDTYTKLKKKYTESES